MIKNTPITYLAKSPHRMTNISPMIAIAPMAILLVDIPEPAIYIPLGILLLFFHYTQYAPNNQENTDYVWCRAPHENHKDASYNCNNADGNVVEGDRIFGQVGKFLLE